MDTYQSLLNMVKGKHCAILGLGVSNLPLVRLLLALDSQISLTIYDKKSPEELGSEALALINDRVNFICGANCFDNIEGEVIFRSPGIRPDIKGIREALQKGAILTSEMEAFLHLSPALTFGITGSDGKTTSTTLCGKFLEGSARVFVGGNIGTPLLDKASGMCESDRVVLELSSFQLMTLKDAPCCSAITNISPNHMDWHTSLEEYAESKYNIIGKNTRRVVLNADSEKTLELGKRLLERGNKEIIFFSSSKTPNDIPPGAKLIYLLDGIIYFYDNFGSVPLLDSSRILLPGKHNIENYMTAMALTYGYVDTKIYEQVAQSFKGVEHRLELVRKLNGVDYYNSSIDSSPTRTAAALSALSGRDIVAICGGYDKNLSYKPLAESLCSSVRAVVLTGDTAKKINYAILECSDYNPEKLTVVQSSSFEDALLKAHNLARKGGCVILTPACASFDRFKNFDQRGKYFKELVSKL